MSSGPDARWAHNPGTGEFSFQESFSRDEPELAYYGWDGDTAWAFRSAEELGAWAALHPQGTWDVQVRGGRRFHGVSDTNQQENR